MRDGLEPPKLPLGWKLWFAFCALLGIGATVLLGWLVIVAIGWLQRH